MTIPACKIQILWSVPKTVRNSVIVWRSSRYYIWHKDAPGISISAITHIGLPLVQWTTETHYDRLFVTVEFMSWASRWAWGANFLISLCNARISHSDVPSSVTGRIGCLDKSCMVYCLDQDLYKADLQWYNDWQQVIQLTKASQSSQVILQWNT